MNSVEVKYGSELHTNIIKAIRDRKKASSSKMDEFKRQWDDADDSMRAYIPEKEIDRKRKDRRRYNGKPQYVTIEVPYIYAQVMTAHTYYSTVFLDRSPIWQFTGRHGETQDSIDAVEAVMHYQSTIGEQIPVLYNWLYDWARYNLGVVGLYWHKEVKRIIQYVDMPVTLMGVPVPLAKPKRVRQEQEIPGYVGNKLYNVRPHDFFPDPRVPIWRFQDGEFCITQSNVGESEILNEAAANPGYYINLAEMKKRAKEKAEKGEEQNQGSPRVSLPLTGTEADVHIPGARFFLLEDMYIKLVPASWGLGPSKKVEMWCFTVADKEVVVKAHPLGCLHDKFPFAIVEGNFGSESFAKQGLIEMIRPMTDIITWLVNTHFYNVRKTLNDTRLVDPTAVVIKDLERTMEEEGGIIRLKPEAYGRDVRSFMMQLQTTDMTRTHMTDVAIIEQMIQKCSGVMDNIMGVQSAASRKSATEARISSGYAIARLKTPAGYNSHLGFSPLSQMMVSNTQQFLDVERQYAIAGETLMTAKKYLNVSPDSIAGFFDYVPVDPTMPVDPQAKANFWKELLIQMARVPQFAMQWDLGAMISHMMKLQGERNIDRFRINVLPPGVQPQGMPIGVPGAPAAAGPNSPGSSGGA